MKETNIRADLQYTRKQVDGKDRADKLRYSKKPISTSECLKNVAQTAK